MKRLLIALLLACSPALAVVRYELADTETQTLDITTEKDVVSADLVAGQLVVSELLCGFAPDGDLTNGAELTITLVREDATYGNIPIGKTLTYTVNSVSGVAYIPIGPVYAPQDGTYTIRILSDAPADTSVTVRGIIYEEGDWTITPSSDGPATDGAIRFDAPRGRTLYARIDQSTTIDLTASGTTYTLANADVVTAGVSGTAGTPVAHTITVQQQIGGSKLTNDPTRGEFYAEWNGSGWSTVYLDAATITAVADASATATDAEVADDFTSTGVLIAAVNTQATTAATQASSANAKLPADTSTKIGTLPSSGTVATTSDLSGITGGGTGYDIAYSLRQVSSTIVGEFAVLKAGEPLAFSEATLNVYLVKPDGTELATTAAADGSSFQAIFTGATLTDHATLRPRISGTIDAASRNVYATEAYSGVLAEVDPLLPASGTLATDSDLTGLATATEQAAIKSLVQDTKTIEPDPSRTWVPRRGRATTAIAKRSDEAVRYYVDFQRMLGRNENLGAVGDVSIDVGASGITIQADSIDKAGTVLSFIPTGGTAGAQYIDLETATETGDPLEVRLNFTITASD